MDQSPRLSLPHILASQAQKHITHNEAIEILDTLVQSSVQSRSLASPPDLPAEGACYIVGADPAADWQGRSDSLAVWRAGAWTFYPPFPGMTVYVAEEGGFVHWDGNAWTANLDLTNVPRLGVNAVADDGNRLAVAADSSLFSCESADHRLIVNKAGESATASVLFQSGYSGRAEIGLAGGDALSLKVSADGSAWRTALTLDPSSGAASFPNSALHAAPNLLVNGAFLHDQRAFGGGALAANAYGYDRWRAGASGADLSVSAGRATLASGQIRQTVEPELWGLSSFAGMVLTLSVSDLTGGDLRIGIGGKAATIAAGSGRRAASLVMDAGLVGPLFVTIEPAGAACAFADVKLELGGSATPWRPRSLVEEFQLCRRYYRQMTSNANYAALLNLVARSSTLLTAGLVFDQPMRRAPDLGSSGIDSFQLLPGGTITSIALFGISPTGGYWSIEASGISAGSAYAFFSRNDPNAFLSFSAEY